MNLEDVLNEDGLQQDEWSLTAPTFGKHSQIKVVGWSGKSGSTKYYIVQCSTCSEDPELFGQGYFKDSKAHLLSNGKPCGCSSNSRRSETQYSVLCYRKAEELGYTFLKFNGEWKGNKTRVSLLCAKHGQWDTSCINDFLNTHGCPKCGVESTRKSIIKTDDVMVPTFFISGAFHPDTKFCCILDEDSGQPTALWSVYCPECGQSSKSKSNNLQNGHRPCFCSKHRQQECYINWVIDENNDVVAIKFGIAVNSDIRVQKQHRMSIYKVINFVVYSFADVLSCKQAERECKMYLKCGTLSKEDMPDGHTETTSVANLLKVIEIYKQNGGTIK